MKVVVVGSGGREHALASVLGRDAEVVVTPGNPAIPGSVSTSVEDLVAAGDVDLVVFGPEQPLVAGKADRLRAKGARVFGPGWEGAQLEGSKAYMKLIAEEAQLPTAAWRSFTDDEVDEAVSYLTAMKPPYVVKTDGLAAGKGVLVTDSLADAVADVRSKLSGRTFGAAGRQIVIEEGLVGPEVSVFAVCDGQRAVCLPVAQDFKRVGDGDTGLNTGGMGAWSPLPPSLVPAGFEDEVNRVFIEPTLAELRQRGIDFRGCLYAGFILTNDGPKLLEYNVRFGDPDSQVVLLRMTSSLTDLLVAAADGDLTEVPAPTFSDEAAVLVVAASEGYPVHPRTGDVIEGIDEAGAVEGVTVLAAGVGQRDGGLTTAGGRVLNVVGIGSDAATARERAYQGIAQVTWPGEHHRTDIAAG